MLNPEQVAALISFFDKDGSKTINMEEFLTMIRGELNDFRLGLITRAYDCLDVNKDGLVKLDDIAKLYDVSQHPDILQGTATQKEVYLKFMSLWDTQTPDGIVTLEEFCEYFRDVSAAVEKDEYFEAMMKSCWKI
uniref:EF-hand domain-containing protein n=1 Tax=Strombidium inclinatum TaxID=197538 RepID=A0A7S3IFE3_9SPIT|mmetsp:Transcript_12297/g.19072  ORF Transcript_12297/g.19072 Transcript_12297/m.19072 type:complete len:135 (+) Transcript_12297:1043-1447(+)